MRSFEILLVVESEAVAQALSATLQRAGHRVTASTTIAGTIETLMRRGRYIDVIITNTRFDSSLGDDAIQYGHKFAAHARVIVLREVAGRLEDVELALAQPVRAARTRGRAISDWN